MKKSLSAIFCLVIMLSLSVPVSASAFDSSNYASSNSSAVAQSQYEMLMDSFGFDSSLSDIVYPSNYGGAYINSEGALVVMQTNSISSSSRGGNFASVLNEAGSFILDTVSSTSALQKSSPHFDDVPSSYWAYDAIMEAAEAGIVFGFGDGTFQPNSPVTYAQFSALLGRAFYPSELDFSDYDSWYEPYTIVLSEHNVLLNLESDKLDNSLSIFDMAQLLYNVLVDYCIFSPSDPPFISSLDNLHLLDNIPSEYHSAIRTIYSLGLLDDFFDLFSTGDIRISRAQACIVINRLSSYLTPGNKTTLSGLIIGGQLTVSETTPIDAKILLSNAGCDVFSYSAILALKYYKEGSWVDIPFNSPDNTVSEVAILHQLMPGQEKVFTFDLSYYYGSISEGYYKLEIVLTQNGKNYSLSDIFFISN